MTIKLVNYLNFGGNCATAFKYYERVLNGKMLMMMTHGDMPVQDQAQVPPDWKTLIMHARLAIGDQLLMGSDSPPDRFEKPQGMWVALQLDDPKDADRIFAALADNGNIHMPIQQTFWAARFGMVIDQFGIPWMVNCEPKQN
jgi:PhnB protein